MGIHIGLALALLAVVSEGSPDTAPACDAFPRVDPWETEAFTSWTPDMLEPSPAEDAVQFKAPTAGKTISKSAFSLTNWLSSGTSAGGAQEEAAVFVGCGHVRVLSGVVPVAGAVGAAMANVSAFAAAAPNSKVNAEAGRGSSNDHGAVFVVLNGANDGVWVRYDPLCLGTVALAAADAMKPRRSKRRQLFLYSVAGRPVDEGAGVDRALRMLQLLVEGEAWVWGGVAPGFAFRVGVPERVSPDGAGPPQPVLLRTLTLSPRALQVVGVLGVADSASLIASGGNRMVRSPEKHYAAGFENYRTSKSAFLTGRAPTHAMVRRTSQWVARLAELEHAEWPQLLRYDPGDWYKTHRDTFHDYKHPNAHALVRHKNRVKQRKLHPEGEGAGAGAGHEDSGATLAGWVGWVRARLPKHGASLASVLKDNALDPFTWRAAADEAEDDELAVEAAGRARDDGGSSAFELALVGLLLGDAQGRASVVAALAHDASWLAWLEANHARGSHRLLSALLGGDGFETETDRRGGGDEGEDEVSGARGRPIMPAVRAAWERAVGAPPALVWADARAEALSLSSGARSGVIASAAAAEEAEEELDEDVLGPPWVEPNRHCTLMYYLNKPANGGGETTFPLADTTAVASPDGALLLPSSAGSAAVVHPGMPECSKGLRVQPFAGGGALFYHKLGDGANDPKSSHGGCPPLTPPPEHPARDSVSWKINGFMWNYDSGDGPGLYRS